MAALISSPPAFRGSSCSCTPGVFIIPGAIALTLIPFDRRLIDKDMLSLEELKWLNDYHIRVKKEISPMLDKQEDLKWINWACSQI